MECRYQQTGESGAGPDASPKEKIKGIEQELPGAKKFWEFFSCLPGCDYADIITAGTLTEEEAVQAAPTASRRPRPQRRKRSPDQASLRSQFFMDYDSAAEEKMIMGPPDPNL